MKKKGEKLREVHDTAKETSSKVLAPVIDPLLT
jgi:hypothetical protein